MFAARKVASMVAVGFTLSLCGCVAPGPALTTVESVDVARYMGKWYEIASYPNNFQQGCTGTSAEYALLADGRVRVENTCFKNSLDGEVDRIVGSARVVDKATNAKLKVSFFWPFEGDYWVIDLDDEDYQWAVVGEPTRQFLWILCRAPQMDDALYAEILDRLPEKGYDAGRLRRTLQVEE